MNAPIKRVVVVVTGWAFVLLGIAGLFLPILQGVLFIFIGLAILSSEYIWAHHLLLKIRNRFPGVSSKAEKGVKRAADWLHRMYRQRE